MATETAKIVYLTDTSARETNNQTEKLRLAKR